MKNSEHVNRIAWIDIAKFICIVFVLLSHMEYLPGYAVYIFKPFFLTGFFFLSGYTFHTKTSFKTFLSKRIRTILVPTIVFSCIYAVNVGAIMQGQYSALEYLSDLSVLLRQQRGQGDLLWFTYVLFLSEIPLYWMCKTLSRSKIVVISAFLCEVSILYSRYWMKTVPYWYVHIIFVCMFFEVCGFCARESKTFQRYIGNKFTVSSVLVLYAILSGVSAVVFHDTANINQYGVPDWLWYALTLLGVASVTGVSSLIKPNRLISWCGKNTLVFYLLHDRIRGIINFMLRKLGILSFLTVTDSRKTLCCLLVLCIEIVVLCICVIVIERYFGWLFGKNKKY